MTAEEYLSQIRRIDKRIEALSRDEEKTRSRLYNISGIDYSKDRVDGGGDGDISSRLICVDNILTGIAKKKIYLIEARETARQRINALSDNRFIPILTDYYISALPIEAIIRAENYEQAQIYRLRKRGVECFGHEYYRWLMSMTNAY